MPLVVHIGDRLRKLRQRKLMSQRELAEKTGMSHNTIVQLEKDRTEPHYRTLRKLVQALEVEPEELLGGEEDR